MKRSSLFLMLATAALVGGCGSSGGGGISTMSAVEIQVTDAPFEHWMVDEATVRLDAVRLHEDPDATSGFLTIMEGKEVALDLTKLTNGMTELLLSSPLPPGDYAQARLNITGARIKLVNGKVFSTENGLLTVAAFPAAGYRVVLDPPVHAHAGRVMRLLIDFDLTKSFRPLPADIPLAASSVLMLPTMRCVDVEKCGEVRGVVEHDNVSTGEVEAVNKALVYLMPPGEIDIENRVATTGTEADGSFALLGVDPGVYDVVALKGETARINSVVVTMGGVSNADLFLK